jgi:biotin carboxylase
VDSPGGLAAAIAVVGLPAVLKPRRGAASVGVSFLTGDADVRTEVATRAGWTNLVLEGMIPHAARPAGCAAWLADFVSVDTVTGADGVHRHVTVVDKLPHSVAPQPSPVAIRETGNVMPSGLPADRLDAVFTATSTALDALAVRGRVSHTELRVGPSTVEPIEVNGRMGGFIADMLRRMDGPDLLAAAFDVALGGTPQATRRLRPGMVASLWIPFAERSGTVLSAASRPRLRAVPGVERVDGLARRGDPRAATGFHAARVTVWAAGQEELDRVVAGVLDEVAAMFAADRLGGTPWFAGTRRLLPGPVTTSRSTP